MGNRVHLKGEFVCVDPEYQGKGLAAALFEFACHRCDLNGVEFYTDATPISAPMYAKYFGFEPMRQISMPSRPGDYAEYTVIAMVRPPRPFGSRPKSKL
ncbi:hypothetical protein DRE_03238 [Drechslerella stenobrocha 248]|uniref:N-acetyltransferase domain-containing protein n=1 Tax=Drechslerella stenobrocha 248 TaxID=1043628 RepID=W7I641_9PEZI|nr:hypothetical protein DRE_03238 [Drechslerella stenobrocha 248]